MIRLVLCVFSYLFAVSETAGEHRAALVIDNANSDLSTVKKSLERYGFSHKVRQGLTDKQLRSTIDTFCRTTPVRGTALVYFAGPVVDANSRSAKGVHLVGKGSKRGHSLALVLKALAEQGGSRWNIVVIATAKPPQLKLKLPSNCAVYFTKGLSVRKSDASRGLLADLKSQATRSYSSIPATIQLSLAGTKSISSPERLLAGKNAGDEWLSPSGAVFCWCPPGKFTKGSPTTESGRYPDEKQSRADIKRGFWVSKYEMTLSEYTRNRPRKSIATHKNHPLTTVHWDDLRSTLRNLNKSERRAGRLPQGWEYALPSEEQWEYAARAGTTGRFHFGTDADGLPKFANFSDKRHYDTASVFAANAHPRLDDGHARLAIVGSYQANRWGLHDVHGNVAEWCRSRAIRGGSWVSTPRNCRCAHRHVFSGRAQEQFIGSRLVIQPVGQ